MSTETDNIESLVNRRYKHGFVTDIDQESFPPGLDENVICAISARKNEPEFMLEWRLKAYHHWLTMKEPEWAHVHYPPINYQDISYFSAPKSDKDRPRSLDEVDPKLLETYEKLGIPLHERAALAGVAVDAVFDRQPGDQGVGHSLRKSQQGDVKASPEVGFAGITVVGA